MKQQTITTLPNIAAQISRQQAVNNNQANKKTANGNQRRSIKVTEALPQVNQ